LKAGLAVRRIQEFVDKMYRTCLVEAACHIH
jgi:hypothetical protein